MKIFLLIILTLHLASSTHQGHLMTRKLQSILTFATTKSNYQPLCFFGTPKWSPGRVIWRFTSQSGRNLKNIKQNLTFRTKTSKNVWFSATFEPWEYCLLNNYTFLKVVVPKVYFYLMFLRFCLPKVVKTLKTLNKTLLSSRKP